MDKNIALILAGGVGSRMKTKEKPKQFIELHGKPIIIYTLEVFDKHPEIDGIVVVCIEEWILPLKKMIQKFRITKIVKIVTGGETSQDSIYQGLIAISKNYSQESIVLIHDSVRPLITNSIITTNILKVKATGSCITCTPAAETIIVKQEDNMLHIPKRDHTLIARAPQSFILSNILNAHRMAQKDRIHNFIDSCTMMTYYGYKLSTIIGNIENIKITTPMDYFIFRSLKDIKENSQFNEI